MGHHNRHFYGDVHANGGAWSPPTSVANFCEEDYAVTRFIAEFVNALTNLTYVYFGLMYMYGPGNGTRSGSSTRGRQDGRGGSGGGFSMGDLVPRRWDFMSLAIVVLGVGSFLFHASMRQSMQFVDDLSMLVLAWSMLQCVWAVRQPPARRRVFDGAIALIILSFSGFYLWSGSIIYHTIAFLSMMLILTLRYRYLVHCDRSGGHERGGGAVTSGTANASSSNASPNPKSAGKLLADEKTRKDWNWRTWKSTFFSLVGYGLWQIDLEYCAELRSLRAQVGLPWAWFLELHGWWHILTAVGASRFMDVAREVRDVADREHKLE